MNPYWTSPCSVYHFISHWPKGTPSITCYIPLHIPNDLPSVAYYISLVGPKALCPMLPAIFHYIGPMACLVSLTIPHHPGPKARPMLPSMFCDTIPKASLMFPTELVNIFFFSSYRSLPGMVHLTCYRYIISSILSTNGIHLALRHLKTPRDAESSTHLAGCL